MNGRLLSHSPRDAHPGQRLSSVPDFSDGAWTWEPSQPDSATAVTTALAAPLRVFCYGDSLTAGTSPPLDELYPYAPTLEKALGSSVLVRHRGLPGVSADAMLQHADDEQNGLRSLLRKSSPALVIILAGTNDLGYASGSAPIVRSVCGLHELSHELSDELS